MRTYLLVAVAGTLGAAIRWGIGDLIDHRPATFPWATLSANVAGCALIGLAARSLARGSDRWQFAVTGLLGGLTTFSTFAVETRELVDADRAGLALGYVAASVVVGLAAVEVARHGWRSR
ncbi:MAG TPA: CrcB family protein [Ilumatobacter sp.]